MRKTLLFAATFALFTIGLVPVAGFAHASQINSGVDITSQKVTENKAKAIALNAIKGQNKTVMHVHLESDDGQNYYEILVRSDNTSYEVEIDALTGNVLEIEKEPGHDNYGQLED